MPRAVPACSLRVAVPPGACHLEGALSQEWALYSPVFLTVKTTLWEGPVRETYWAVAQPWLSHGRQEAISHSRDVGGQTADQWLNWTKVHSQPA